LERADDGRFAAAKSADKFRGRHSSIVKRSSTSAGRHNEAHGTTPTDRKSGCYATPIRSAANADLDVRRRRRQTPNSVGSSHAADRTPTSDNVSYVRLDMQIPRDLGVFDGGLLRVAAG